MLSKNDKTKILLVIYGDIHFGGVSVLLNNLLDNMDRSDFEFTLYAFGNITDEEMFKAYADKGVRVIIGLKEKYNKIKYAKDLAGILRLDRYDIIHINTGALGMTALTLKISKLLGVKTRIAHSHSSFPSDYVYSNCQKKSQRKNNRLATVKVACSKEAAAHLFGNTEAIILKNGIDSKRFSFSGDMRSIIRTKLGVKDRLVIGTVGRLEPVKNQAFILEIAKEMSVKRDVSVLIVGSGSLKNDLVECASKLGIRENVIFVEANDRVEDYLNAMDVFLLPSRSEGLGISAIEAQSMDLPTWCSLGVPTLASVTEKVHFMDLAEGPEKWCESILQSLEGVDLESRSERRMSVREKGYDIEASAKVLEELYKAR